MLVVILFCWCIPLQANSSFKLFTSGSYIRILQQHKGQAFVMVLWSVDCVACLKELAMLGQFKQRYPQLQLILISTDTPDIERDIQSLLTEYNLEQSGTWVFEDDAVQRLRYEIDQSWYGEVPRTYLFDAEHYRQTVTGELKREQLHTWLKAVTH